MNFLILEDEKEINISYLSYLIENWHKIFLYKSDVDKSIIDAIIIRSKIIVDSEFLNDYKNLKYICRIWVWLDKIDLAICENRWIKVLNTAWSNSDSVADLALWWILSLLRKTNNTWQNIDDRFNFYWRNLSNLNIWFIWFWNIAKRLYSRLSSFPNNNFCFYDPFSSFSDNKIIKINSKEELFSKCDIISFHIPLTKDTKDFLSKEEFKLLKNNSIIINTSRWWIVNEEELINFLTLNPESWAFLDTWDEEPENPKQSLLSLNNCIITPHIWAMTEESNKNMHYFEEFTKKEETN